MTDQSVKISDAVTRLGEAYDARLPAEVAGAILILLERAALDIHSIARSMEMLAEKAREPQCL